jgi:hypothetical protein
VTFGTVASPYANKEFGAVKNYSARILRGKTMVKIRAHQLMVTMGNLKESQ